MIHLLYKLKRRVNPAKYAAETNGLYAPATST
jgi:hypothetical protein